MKKVIETIQLTKTFFLGDVKVHALRGINLTIYEGEFVAIMGSSGSGKSTLMNLLGCLDQPTSGEYYLNGVITSKMTKNEYANIRNQNIGFVFQGFNLLPRTSALENVELPLLYDRHGRVKNPIQQAKDALKKVGLADRMDHEPNQLSGGQQQRVAIARALVNSPSLILADEPTGNLDSVTSVDVFSLFQELNDNGITIVIVTHEREFAKYARRIVEVKDGLILDDYEVKNRLNAKEDMARLKHDESVVVVEEKS
ncbi:MAG: ABC transporter ATP-binding protein [Melioribacteraceae bacterium]|nr:ABC transporter ATP-binding protein [Melioribacteraceae bacterium]